MATSRRNFLKTGTLGLLCAGLPAGLAKAVIGRSILDRGFGEGKATGAVSFTKEAFALYVGSTFRIKAGSASVDLRLTKVTDLKAISKTPSRIAGRESFSLLFKGSSKAPLLTQDTRTVEHHELGRFSLFLVPVGRSTNRHYEAIIIRL
jgi:hypothetical protein